MANLIPSVEQFAKGVFATAAGASTISLGLLYYGQNFLIYPSAFPPGSRTEVAVPTQYGMPHFEDLTLKTPDGVSVRAYLIVQQKVLIQSQAPEIDAPADMSDEDFAATRPTIMMFHGNGGNMGHRLPLAKIFYVQMRCNVMMLSYRGYGLSEGTPSEKGIRMDAQTALDYLSAHEHLSKSPVILYGQSIGGAVSVDLASRNPSKIRALILENTFTSLPRLIPHALPLLSPFAFLCHQKWDSISKVALLPPAMPILMLSGLRDEVVPCEQMRILWAEVARTREDTDGIRERAEKEAQGEAPSAVGASRLVAFEAGAHNDTCMQRGYWTYVANFVAGLGAAGAPEYDKAQL